MRLLDEREAITIADAIIQTLDELGFSTEEAIPGLIQAVIQLAQDNPSQLLAEAYLDEAANLLADAGVEKE